MRVWDAAVIGGGTGGAAAAIRIAEASRSCLLLERRVFPRERPGETLHPGVEPLLRQIDLWDAVSACSVVRPLGIRVSTSAGTRVETFGEDSSGPCRGLQVRRADFDTLLIGRARSCGVVVSQQQVRALTVNRGWVRGVITNEGEIAARMVIDAGGGQHLLARLLALQVERHSPQLLAAYGYVDGAPLSMAAEEPCFSFDERGWT